jgi:hypothetical protein
MHSNDIDNTVYLDYDLRATLSSGRIVTLARGKAKVTDTESA